MEKKQRKQIPPVQILVINTQHGDLIATFCDIS